MAVDIFFVLNMYVNCFSGKQSNDKWEAIDDEHVEQDLSTINCNRRCITWCFNQRKKRKC